ncbi:hypothetical protein PMI14_06425 [Acidovorax sp. CF316]|uniref:hypothetical protein n=1 Tax=Acidovorax sp. CF316 TaxID=1144317 RepID=UPI00026BEF5C|nr:hypothetical protein [Acidovorax sp. CF316]EJE49131.1 hypothetical protein PMI14_06425 [Acidovorax sp. CF316]
MDITNLPACLVSYFAAWNATDPAAMHRHVANAFGKDTRYLDPHRSATGVEEFVDCLIAFRVSTPDATISWASGVDSHHHLHRYAWRLRYGTQDVTGYDVVEVDADQRIVAVLSFFGPLPSIH